MGEKIVLFEPFVSKKRAFYQDRLGTNIGEALYKSMFFSGGETAESTHGPALAMSFTQPLVRNQFSLIELNYDDAVQRDAFRCEKKGLFWGLCVSIHFLGMKRNKR